MLAVSTGVFSGSSLDDFRQVSSTVEIPLTVPENAKSVSFYYNVISEEMPEWQGQGFNDKITNFFVKPSTREVLAKLAEEDIDTSNWEQKEVDENFFPGGDSTAGILGWNKVELSSDELKNLAGQDVMLRVHVEDSGDTIYNTTALISDINFVTEVEKQVPTGNKTV